MRWVHWTVMVHGEVCVWSGQYGKPIFDVDQNVKSLPEGSYGITSAYKWVFTVPSEEEATRLKTGAVAAM